VGRNLELSGAVDVMIVRVKRIDILRNKVNKLFLFFSSLNCLKEIEDLLSSSLSMHSLSGRVPTVFPVLPNVSYFLQKVKEVIHRPVSLLPTCLTLTKIKTVLTLSVVAVVALSRCILHGYNLVFQ